MTDERDDMRDRIDALQRLVREMDSLWKADLAENEQLRRLIGTPAFLADLLAMPEPMTYEELLEDRDKWIRRCYDLRESVSSSE